MLQGHRDNPEFRVVNGRPILLAVDIAPSACDAWVHSPRLLFSSDGGCHFFVVINNPHIIFIYMLGVSRRLS